MKTYNGGLFELPDKRNVFVGIDQSYSGFGITAVDKTSKYYTWVFAGKGSGTPRLIDIERQFQTILDDLASVFHISDVAMEGYAFRSPRGHMMGELGGLIKVCLAVSYEIYPLIIPPTRLKKFATGKGSSSVSKSVILLSVYRKWGAEFDNDNAADSYVLARIARGTGDLAYEKEILREIKEEESTYRDSE